MAQPQGIDISSYQGDINWDELYNNTAFAFIKATEGPDYVDAKFTRNQAGARRVGIPCGFYHFAGSSLSGKVGNANSEANHFYDNLGPLVAGEWIILDWEIEYADPVGWCLNWFQRIQQLTLSQTMGALYLDVDRLNRFDWQPLLDAGVVIYIANPSGLPVRYDHVAIQTGYTVVPGIIGRVDADAFNADNMDSFRTYGYRAPAPVPPTPPAPTPPVTPTPDPTPPPVVQPPIDPPVVSPPVAEPTTLLEKIITFLKGFWDWLSNNKGNKNV